MPSALHTVRVGVGPALLLVHGSAADHATWSIQLASGLTAAFTLIAYDRRGCGDAGLGSTERPSVEDHAADAAELVHALGVPVIAVGSSFGAVVALELARRHPALVRGLVLCEPPLAPADDVPAVPPAFHARFDHLVETDGGPAAAAMFLRTVLGDAAFERMPARFRDRAQAQWRAIRADSDALGRYRVRYPQLAALVTPTLLLAGERSAPYFRPTIDALAAALPAATVVVLPAGHMMHAEAPRRFAEAVTGFAAGLSVGVRTTP